MAEPVLSPAFLESAAATIGLPVPAGRAAGVRAYLDRIAEMAAPLLACSISDEIESAQVFDPGFSISGIAKP